ncbi:MAG: TolC family protein [Thermoanaerobaculales bacterium]|jgi:outer membrane protein TolC|nr:TolC family protein [Thermoanaerobaculales bacterium]
MRSTLLTATLILAAAAAGAQELTVAEAVGSALDNNPEVAAARARAAAAASRLEGGRSHRMPRISVSESYVLSDTPAEVFALTLNQERFDFQGFFSSDPNSPEALSTWMTRVGLELPIYTGGVLSARIGQAASMATAEEHLHAHARQKVAFDTVAAYIDLAKAREHVALLEKARSTTAEHLRIAEQYAAQGMILEAEVLRARVFLAELDEYLSQAASGARLAQAALNFHMGAEQATPRSLAALPPQPELVGDAASWIAAALEERSDLAAAHLKLEAGRLEETASRPGYVPKVAVVGHYDLYDDSIFGSNGRSGSVMAVASIDLWGGGAGTADRAAARHETAAFEADLRRFEEGVRLEVEQAWQELATARTRHATAMAALDAAREGLRVRESRFSQGLDRMIDLLDAETALREAETRELVARFDVVLGSHRLKFVAGKPVIETMEENS